MVKVLNRIRIFNQIQVLFFFSFLLQADVMKSSKNILCCGLLFAEKVQFSIDQSTETLTFQHRLLQEFTAAYYLCQQVLKDGPSFLNSAIPDWDCIMKQKEVILFVCGRLRKLNKGATIVDHVARSIAEHLNRTLESGDSLEICSRTSIRIFQEEADLPKLNKYFSIYPECGGQAKDILAQSEFVLFNANGIKTDRDGASVDLGLPPDNVIGKIIITDVSERFFDGLMKMLDKHKDCVQAILFNHWRELRLSPGLQLSLLPSSLRTLQLAGCCINDEENCELLGTALKGMSHLTRLELMGNKMVQHGAFIVEALEATADHSKLRHLDLRENFLPEEVSAVLLSALTGHTQLQNLLLGCNHLTGCVANLMQSPPPSIRAFYLDACSLNADDIRSISSAIQQGKLSQIESLNINENEISKVDLQPLLWAVEAHNEGAEGSRPQVCLDWMVGNY